MQITCQSQLFTGQICLFILVALSTYEVASQTERAANTFTKIILPDRPIESQDLHLPLNNAIIIAAEGEFAP